MRIAAVIGVNLLCISVVFAQDYQNTNNVKPTAIDPTLSIGSAHGLLLSGLKIDGYEYISTTFGVSEEGAKLTWAPFFLSNNYNRLYSETRIEVAGDASSDQSSIGVAFKYNPYNPRSSNGLAVFDSMKLGRIDPHRIIQERLESIRLLRSLALIELSRQENVTCPLLIKDTVLAESSPIIALNSQLMEHENSRKPLNKAQLELLRCALSVINDTVNESLRNIARLERTMSDPPTKDQKELHKKLTDIEKSGRLIYDRFYAFAASSYHAERNEAMKSGIADGKFDSISEINNILDIEQQIALHIANNKSDLESAGSAENLQYRKALFTTFKPIVTLSYKGAFFNVIGNQGRDVDADNNGASDNERTLASRALSLGVDWPYSETQNLSFLVGRSYERALADGLSPASDYNSYGLSWGVRLKVLNDPGYKSSDEFKKSLFVPSINFGISASYKECLNKIDSNCINYVTHTQEIMPFLDFKINEAAQFRVGVPFIRKRTFIPAVTDEDDPSKNSSEDIQIFGAIKVSLGKP